MTSFLFNLAESLALVRLDSDKPDNLHPDGNYHELAMCSFFHLGLFTVGVRTFDLSFKYLPSVVVQKKADTHLGIDVRL